MSGSDKHTSLPKYTSVFFTIVKNKRIKGYRCRIHKTFFLCSYILSKKARVFGPGKPFQICVMFASKTRACPSGAPSPPGINLKYFTRLDRLTKVEHFSLFVQLVSYKDKSFVNTPLTPEWTSPHFINYPVQKITAAC